MDRGSIHDINDIMMKYAMYVVSLEAFSLDSALDSDVLLDGYNSKHNNIRMRFTLG